MPIHQTKLMIANAHAGGHVGAPHADAGRRRCTRCSANEHERQRAGRSRTRSASARPPRARMRPNTSSCSSPTVCGSSALTALLRVADLREVLRARPRAEIVERLEAGARRDASPRTACRARRAAPNWIAPVGHACWHAVTTSPACDRRAARRARDARRRGSAARSTCTSPSRRATRTVTSGLYWSARGR